MSQSSFVRTDIVLWKVAVVAATGPGIAVDSPAAIIIAYALAVGGGARLLEDRFALGAPIEPAGARQCRGMFRLATQQSAGSA
jgi:hypothetical protein